MSEVTEFATREALMAATAERIAEALSAGIAERGEACAALSGGGTPEPAYALLASTSLDWPRVTFALVDERFVPPTHEASNEAMLRRALAPALAKGARLVPMYSPTESVSEAATRADALYAPLRFDIAVMGMGADGHTASWFEGAQGLDAALDPHTAHTVTALHAPQAAGSPERLSLTLAALARAARVLLVITAPEKLARLAAARSGVQPAPVLRLWHPVLPNPNVLWAP